MNHKLVLENSSSAAVYKLPKTIIHLKAIKYLNIRLRQIYENRPETEDDIQSNVMMDADVHRCIYQWIYNQWINLFQPTCIKFN